MDLITVIVAVLYLTTRSYIALAFFVKTIRSLQAHWSLHYRHIRNDKLTIRRFF